MHIFCEPQAAITLTALQVGSLRSSIVGKWFLHIPHRLSVGKHRQKAESSERHPCPPCMHGKSGKGDHAGIPVLSVLEVLRILFVFIQIYSLPTADQPPDIAQNSLDI